MKGPAESRRGRPRPPCAIPVASRRAVAAGRCEVMEGIHVRPCGGAGFLVGPEAAARMGIEGARQVVLRHGNRRAVVPVRVDPAVAPGEIWLPRPVWDRLLLVPQVVYDPLWDGDQLRLGPVLGVIVPRRYLEKPPWKRWGDWAGVYDRVRGLLFVTSAASMNLDEGWALGYGLRPEPEGRRWVWGRYPLPDVAYRRAWLSDRMYGRMAESGVRLFDAECADKWTLYRWLASEREVARHLPWTAPVNGAHQVPELVRRRQRLVLKRRVGFQGRGLLVVWSDGDGGFWVQPRDAPEPQRLLTEGELVAFLQPILDGDPYLAQQAVDLPAYRRCLMDLRVIMQRDARGEWQCTGGAARFGKPGYVASNFVWEGGFGCAPVRGLSLSLDLDRRAAGTLWRHVQAVGLRVCRALEAHGQFGDLGLDMAVDRSGRIWLLEVNCGLQVHRLAVFGGGEEAVRRARQMPLLYARHLAGWPPVGEGASLGTAPRWHRRWVKNLPPPAW